MTNNSSGEQNISCSLQSADYTGVTIVELDPDQTISQFAEAKSLAEEKAEEQFNKFMLISWYDGDRDIESPQHAGDCHVKGAIPGYVEYGLSHGSTLKVDVEKGRFVFFYKKVEL